MMTTFWAVLHVAGLLSLISLLRAFPLTGINRNRISGSSTLATSAAVKTDSNLSARANQARFDTNEHANYYFF